MKVIKKVRERERETREGEKERHWDRRRMLGNTTHFFRPTNFFFDVCFLGNVINEKVS